MTRVSSVSTIGGAGGVNASGGVASGGAQGLLKLSGDTLFVVEGLTSGSFDVLSVNGGFEIDGGVHFAFADDGLAGQFAGNFTLDDFFVINGLPVASVASFGDVNFSGASPDTTYDILLNNDRTFTVTAVPEPMALGWLAVGAGLLIRRRRCGATG
jgi:hypothetical protein